MNEKDQRHLDAVIALYEKKLKKSVDLEKLKEWFKEARDKMPEEHDKAIVSQVTGFILGKTFSEKEAKKK